jgi:hypothetical protein
MTHLLTYNKALDEYQYEIREFDRLIKKKSFFRITENSLDKDKATHYRERYDLVRKNILIKNQKIIEKVLNKRKVKVAKLLDKALSRHKGLTKAQEELLEREQKNKDYFYVRKREFFDILGIAEYMD